MAYGKRFPEANTPFKRVVKFARYYIAYALTRAAYWIDYDGEFNAAFLAPEQERSKSEY